MAMYGAAIAARQPPVWVCDGHVWHIRRACMQACSQLAGALRRERMSCGRQTLLRFWASLKQAGRALVSLRCLFAMCNG